MKTVRFGIIGCGLMGREFASAAARWAHLPQMQVRHLQNADRIGLDTGEGNAEMIVGKLSQYHRVVNTLRKQLLTENVLFPFSAAESGGSAGQIDYA